MTTCRVRFEFYCDHRLEGVQFIHDLPGDLVVSRAAAQQDPTYHERFREAMLPIVKKHETVCVAASSPACGVCALSAATVLLTPMSWLHKDGDPFIGVIVNAVCGRSECELQTRREVQEEWSAIGAQGEI